MSEQTPESTIDANVGEGFAADDAEPSMEDILASIRKIISDDSDPVPLDGPVEDATSRLEPKPEEITPQTGAAPGALTAGPQASSAVQTVETVEDNIVDMSPDIPDDNFDIESLMGDFEASVSEDDLVIPEIEETPKQTAMMASVSDPAEVVDIDMPDMDDMDRLMNDMLMGMEETSEDIIQTAPSSQKGPVASTISEEDDIDLVRSLMEGLTDEDLVSEDMSAIETLSAEDAAVSEPSSKMLEPARDATQTSEPDPVEVPLDVLDAMEDDIFDTILDMTIEDEVKATTASEVVTSETEPSIPSLADIAAAAEAEAKAEPIKPVEAAAVLGGPTLAASKTPVSPEPTSASTAETGPVADDTHQSNPDTQKPDIQEMETPMPSALRSDAILDDVTEQATIGAFAQLNQVVEDKAVLSERGPRIGDLVQEALRPMLKDWLDENLQGIVERAVAKEVKRLSSGK